MKLLVVTPTLGASSWLEETVASVAAQLFACEHTLVAPASVTRELAARYPRVSVVPDPGGGMYAAINRGVLAAGEWDAFSYINDDDLLLRTFAAVVNTTAREANRPLIGYGGVRLVDSTGRRLGAIPVSPFPRINRALYALRIEPVYQHGTVFTRAAWEELGGFDESLRYCGDSELLARACVRRIPFVRATGAEVAAYRLRAGQLTKHREASLCERDRVDQQLDLRSSRATLGQLAAKWLFRVANSPVYVERVARHGFVSFNELIERTQ